MSDSSDCHLTDPCETRCVPRWAALACASFLLLLGCDDPEQASFAVEETLVVGTVSASGTPYNVSLATSPDGRTVAAQWNDYDNETGEDRPTISVSTDGGRTFGSPTRPEMSGLFAYAHVAVSETGTVRVGGLSYSYPDPIPEGWSDWMWSGFMAFFESTDSGTSYAPLGDLDSHVATEFVAYTAMCVSPDGETVVAAWLDQSPAPADTTVEGARMWVAISHDGGSTFDVPQLVSERAAPSAQPFLRDGKVGVAFVEQLAPQAGGGAPLPPSARLGTAVVALADEAGHFAAPVRVHGDDEGAVSASVGADVAADGTLYVAWWSGRARAAFYATSRDGQVFERPRVLLDPTEATPAIIEVAVDGRARPWFAVLDGEQVRVLHGTSDGGVASAAVLPVLTTDEMFDIAPLPKGGVLVLYPSATSSDADAGEPSNTEMRVARVVQSSGD